MLIPGSVRAGSFTPFTFVLAPAMHVVFDLVHMVGILVLIVLLLSAIVELAGEQLRGVLSLHDVVHWRADKLRYSAREDPERDLVH